MSRLVRYQVVMQTTNLSAKVAWDRGFWYAKKKSEKYDHKCRVRLEKQLRSYTVVNK